MYRSKIEGNTAGVLGRKSEGIHLGEDRGRCEGDEACQGGVSEQGSPETFPPATSLRKVIRGNEASDI